MKTKTRRKSAVWQLQEAKAMLSEVINSSFKAPQFITVRGEEKAVVLSIDDYKKSIRPKQNLVDFLENSPLADIELEMPVWQPFVFEDLFGEDDEAQAL